jgi:hypothetical protein
LPAVGESVDDLHRATEPSQRREAP